MAMLYAKYLEVGKPNGLSFKKYLKVIGFVNDAEGKRGKDDGWSSQLASTERRRGGAQRIEVPKQKVQGKLTVMVLLVDFADKVGNRSVSDFETMLFSKGRYLTGSMRDFFAEASLGKVDVQGTVHGWLRLPETYAFYAGEDSGTGTYPRNAQRMAEDAIRVAKESGVPFPNELDLFRNGQVTSLFIVHAGPGAEVQTSAALRLRNIWSHKWFMPNPVTVGDNLEASVYLTVPEDAKVGVCAHELGHLAFQWEDFYDPNYAEDGSEWDGAGNWDLMAGGSYNGGGSTPAHPAGLHKYQHGWVDVQVVKTSTEITLPPYTPSQGKIIQAISPEYAQGKQYLIIENRARRGFDSYLPGEGLLVWRVDEAEHMFKPDRPALLLLQADGHHDLEQAGDWNAGDAGDPFPGSTNQTELTDTGIVSTTFPGGTPSGLALRNIKRDPITGEVSFKIEIGKTKAGILNGRAEPQKNIPDASSRGVSSTITIAGAGNVKEVAVSVSIIHDYSSDLRIELKGPGGQTAVLFDRAGGNTAFVPHIYRPAAFKGKPATGNWTLNVSDLVKADVGKLNAWTLDITLA